jgi:hypothetical protein
VSYTRRGSATEGGVKLPKGRAAAKQLSYTMSHGAAKKGTHSYYHHVISHHHSLPCPPCCPRHTIIHHATSIVCPPATHTPSLPRSVCSEHAASTSVQCPTGRQAKLPLPRITSTIHTHQNIQRSRCYITAEPTPHALCNIHKRRHHQHTTLFLLRSAGWSEHDSQLHYTRRNTTIQTTSSLYKRPLYKLSLSHH